MQTVTFPVIIQDVTTPLPVSQAIPFDVTVSGTVNADVKAWRSITINGNITVSSLRTFTAGESIVINPDVLIPANVLLQTGVQPITCGSPNLPQTPAQLNTFCTSNKYKANQLSRLGAQYAAHSGDQGAVDPLPIPFTAAPNPFTGEITLSFSLPEADRVSLTVLDLTGRTVATIWQDRTQEAGEVEVPWIGSELAPGIYIAVLETRRGRETVRIVKQ
ncbi:MAG: T9SS type A sorting domain-containing protein [Bacteroidia bacterium]|nr:T9SS type A sorting domain-containing protein [Bacteroidia bacterium]